MNTPKRCHEWVEFGLLSAAMWECGNSWFQGDVGALGMITIGDGDIFVKADWVGGWVGYDWVQKHLSMYVCM